jgi:hypothetical protein
LLASRTYRWISSEDHVIRLHVLEGTPAELKRDALARAAAAAFDRNLVLLHEDWRGGAIDVFVFSRSSALANVVGHESNGFVQPGEDTALLVYDGVRPPVLQHELMHVLINRAWGVASGASDWLSEGIATWSVGTCQGSTFLQLAAGLDRQSRLPALRSLARDFRKVDELTAFITAASVVEAIVSHRGLSTLRAIWQRQSGGGHPLGPDGDRIEAEWRASLRSVDPRPLDLPRLRAVGCEPPVR